MHDIRGALDTRRDIQMDMEMGNMFELRSNNSESKAMSANTNRVNCNYVNRQF